MVQVCCERTCQTCGQRGMLLARMSESSTTCGSCGAHVASSKTRCDECGSSIGVSPAAALFSMSAGHATNNDFQADVPTAVGPYLAQAMADFGDESDTIVATTTYLLHSIKRSYGPGEPISLLAYDPDSVGCDVVVGLFRDGEEIARRTLTMNNAGTGMAVFADVPAGVVEARFVGGVAHASDRFVVVETWPQGLQAAITDVRIVGNPAQRWLVITLQLGVSGVPYDGAVRLELLDRDNVVSHMQVQVADGRAQCTLAAAGHSPHTLHVNAAGHEETISVPLEWNIQPLELSLGGGAALSLYPINGAWNKDGMYVLNGAGAELPDLGNQLAPTIACPAHQDQGKPATATIDAGVGAKAFALVVVRSARARGMHTPGRTVAAQALAQLDATTGAPPAGVQVSYPPFDRGSVIYNELHATDSSGRLDVVIPTDQRGDWVIDAFVMTDLGWGEAQARLRVD